MESNTALRDKAEELLIDAAAHGRSYVKVGPAGVEPIKNISRPTGAGKSPEAAAAAPTPLFGAEIIKALADLANLDLAINRRSKHFRGRAGQHERAVARRRAANKVARVARRAAR